MSSENSRIPPLSFDTTPRPGTEEEMNIKIATAKDYFDGALHSGKTRAYYEAYEQLSQDAYVWDHQMRPDPDTDSEISRNEERAAFIVQQLREYEREVTFGNRASEAVPGPGTLDMGGQFLTNKHRIENESKIYELAKLVPKGALLHVHFNAQVIPESLLLQARYTDNMYIRSTRPLDQPISLDQAETAFSILDKEKIDSDINIFSPNYPGTATNWKEEGMERRVWMKWSEFQREFEKNFADFDQSGSASITGILNNTQSYSGQVQLSAAEKWIKGKMLMEEDPSQTLNSAWALFNQRTRCIKGLINYEKAYKQYVRDAISNIVNDGVMYVEFRLMLLDKFISADNGKDKISIAEQIQLILLAVHEKQDELRRKREIEKFPFGLKVIYCTPRSISKDSMRNELKECIELKLKFPDVICGFDLVGAEDRPNHIGFYKEELLAFRETCQQNNLEIPFMFHAGETLLDTGGSSSPQNSNLYEAVALGSKRIGHGYSLLKHPHLIDRFRKTKVNPGICVELCPISNELLHLCRNIKEHRFPELLAAGIPCTVNTDNPSIFRNSMCHEFYQILVGAPTISLYGWKQLAYWSIEYSCLSEAEKQQAIQILDRDWQSFCDSIVQNYGFYLTDGKVNIAGAESYRNMRLFTAEQDIT